MNGDVRIITPWQKAEGFRVFTGRKVMRCVYDVIARLPNGNYLVREPHFEDAFADAMTDVSER
jgi:hypothetical protein